jgi:hypothetical protein
MSVRDRLEEQDNFVEEQVNFNNTILQMVKSNTMDDNATAFSAMTMNTAAKDRRIEELEAQIQSHRLRSTPEGGNSVGGGNSYSGTLVAICNDKFDSHRRHTIYNHNPNRYTARQVSSTIKSR